MIDGLRERERERERERGLSKIYCEGLTERETERESCGTGILFKEPNPTGSRPRDLPVIGLCRQHTNSSSRRETEHLNKRSRCVTRFTSETA